MAFQVKELTAKPDDLRFISSTIGLSCIKLWYIDIFASVEIVMWFIAISVSIYSIMFIDIHMLNIASQEWNLLGHGIWSS